MTIVRCCLCQQQKSKRHVRLAIGCGCKQQALQPPRTDMGRLHIQSPDGALAATPNHHWPVRHGHQRGEIALAGPWSATGSWCSPFKTCPVYLCSFSRKNRSFSTPFLPSVLKGVCPSSLQAALETASSAVL
jgi:hypothetical protein